MGVWEIVNGSGVGDRGVGGGGGNESSEVHTREMDIDATPLHTRFPPIPIPSYSPRLLLIPAVLSHGAVDELGLLLRVLVLVEQVQVDEHLERQLGR